MAKAKFPLGPNVQTFVEHVMQSFDWAEIDSAPYKPNFCNRLTDNAPGFVICSRPYDDDSKIHCFEDGVVGLHAEYGTVLQITESNPASMCAIAAVSVILTNQATGKALSIKATKEEN